MIPKAARNACRFFACITGEVAHISDSGILPPEEHDKRFADRIFILLEKTGNFDKMIVGIVS